MLPTSKTRDKPVALAMSRLTSLRRRRWRRASVLVASAFTDAQIFVAGLFQLHELVELRLDVIVFVGGNGLLQYADFLDHSVEVFMECVEKFGLIVTRQRVGLGRRKAAGSFRVFLQGVDEIERGRFLRQISVLAADLAETVIHCLHFTVERIFLLFLRKRRKRLKKDNRENDKNGTLQDCFHKYHPLNERIIGLI
jgi:hypothetical protein